MATSGSTSLVSSNNPTLRWSNGTVTVSNSNNNLISSIEENINYDLMSPMMVATGADGSTQLIDDGKLNYGLDLFLLAQELFNP